MTSLLPALFPAVLLALSSLPHASAYCSPPVLHNCALDYSGLLQTLCYEGNANEQAEYRHCLNNDSDDDGGSGSGLSKGALAGIIVGAVAAVIILIVTLVVVLRRRRARQAREAQQLPTFSPLELERDGSSDSQPGSPMKEKPLPRINLSAVPPVLAKYPSSQDIEQSYKPTQQGTAVQQNLEDRSLVAGPLSVRPTYLNKLSVLLACFYALYFVLDGVELGLTVPSSLANWGYYAEYTSTYWFNVPAKVALLIMVLVTCLASMVVLCCWARIVKRRSSGQETPQGASLSDRTQAISRSLHVRFVVALATTALFSVIFGVASACYFSDYYIDSPEDEVIAAYRRAPIAVGAVSVITHIFLVSNEFVALRRSRQL